MFDLADGSTLDALLKDFDLSPHPRDIALQRGTRERCVYEKVLPGRDLGTAQLYDVVWDGPGGRHWLLLEFVHGRKLRRSSIDEWIAAAAWLGRMQRRVAGNEPALAHSGFLLMYDHDYFLNTAERALQAVTSRGGTLRQRLQAVVSGYEGIVDKVCAGQPTLVHGSYRPSNILVSSSSTLRICPVDWELAAIGPQLHDLAFIADGCDRPTTEQLWEAYAEEAAAPRLAAIESDEMLAELNRLCLHKVLRSLARSADWAYSLDVVTKLVARAETLRHDLG